MATYTDQSLVISSGRVTKVTASDTVAYGGTLQSDTLTVDDNASIGGNLTVQGDIISKGEVDVLISDHFLDLNSGQTTTTSVAGGFTVNVAANTTTAQENASAFTAGAGATGPTFTSGTNPSAFANGDIIQISSSTNGDNDGLFVVNSVSGTTVTIYGTGGTAVDSSLPFCQNQFTAATGEGAKVTKVDLAVLAFSDGNLVNDSGSAITKGVLCFAYAANATQGQFDGTSQGYTEVSDAAASDLQGAYDAGNAIVTTAGRAIAFTGTNGGFTVDGGTTNFGGTTALSSFNLDASGGITVDSSGGAISLDGAAASNLTTSSGDLTIGGATQANAVNIASAEAAADAINIDASDTAGGIDIDAGTGGIAIDSTGAVSIDGAAASNLTTSSGDLTIGGGTQAGAVNIQSTEATTNAIHINASADSGGIDIDAGSNGIAVDTTGALSLDSTGGAVNLSTTSGTGTVSSSGALTLQSSGAAASLSAASGSQVSMDDAVGSIAMTSGALSTSGVTTIDLDGSGAIGIESSGGAISIGADNVNQNINVGTNGTRTLNVGGAASTVNVTSESGTLSLGATGQLAELGCANWRVDATADISLDAAASSNVTVAANSASDVSLTLKATNAGAADGSVSILSDDVNAGITLGSATGTALSITPGSTATVGVEGNLVLEGRASVEFTAAVALVAGEVVYVNSSGEMDKADNDASGTRHVAGVAVGTINASSQGAIHTVYGVPVPMKFTNADATVGGMCYLGATPGEVTQTVPTSGTVFEVGVMLSAPSGAGANGSVLFQPNFVADLS